jgi:hypothetical protein
MKRVYLSVLLIMKYFVFNYIKVNSIKDLILLQILKKILLIL